MKKTGFILTAAFILMVLFYGRIAGADDNLVPGYGSIPVQGALPIQDYSPESINYLELARSKAIEFIGKAISIAPPEVSHYLQGMIEKLKSVRLMVALGGYSSAGCQSDSIAYVYSLNPRFLYLCHSSQKANINELAQTFVHESMHLNGTKDECKATDYEVKILTTNVGGVYYKNGYVDKCGLRNVRKVQSRI